MTTPININPGGSGRCNEPCNMCCTLHSGVKTFTRLRNGSPVTVSCTKLWWNCTCNGNQLVMQRETSADVWVDMESAWFSPTSNWWYPPPRTTARRYRIKCVLDNGFTYFSNPVLVAATWQCHCDDGTSLRRFRVDIDFQYTDTSGMGSSFPWSASLFADVPAGPLGNGIASNSSQMFSVMSASFNPVPMPTNFLNVILSGGALPGDTPAVGEWRLDLGLGSPCTQIAPCAAGPMTYCGTCPNVNGTQFRAVAGGVYVGFSQVVAVNAVLIACT